MAITPGGSSNGSSAESLSELGAQLKASTRHLLQLLARQAGLPGARRLLELLEAVPHWRAADVVAAALARNSQERLAVLLALDHATRIRLALRLVQQALDAVGAGSASTSNTTGNDITAADDVSSSKVGSSRLAIDRSLGHRSLRRGLGFGEQQGSDEEDDVGLLMERLATANAPGEVMRAAAREARRLRRGGEHQPGAAGARAYLELLADLPWHTRAYQLQQQQQQQKEQQQDAAAQEQVFAAPKTANNGLHRGADENHHDANAPGAPGTAAGVAASAARVATPMHPTPGPPPPMPLIAAQQLLDAQHYGLAKVKTRIIQHLAVSRLRGGHGRAPVLCFIGPPGVGKTSLARSIADVLRVPFARVALGGLRDEAEIRGHRRT
eukprot:GHRR01014274.1.p1 GENE.GHRR01014274.1~~GHRR01014274.1.p1  ORF type:complete len:404 (+),score=169.96 GHRR01014274.1:66-1214(+)